MIHFIIFSGYFRELGKYAFSEKFIGKEKNISIKEQNGKKKTNHGLLYKIIVFVYILLSGLIGSQVLPEIILAFKSKINNKSLTIK